MNHILRFSANRGLGHVLSAGIDDRLQHGADITVNTDGHNQYYGSDIPKLVQPILEGRAELAIGDREPARWKGPVFPTPTGKRMGREMGWRIIRRITNQATPAFPDDQHLHRQRF